MKKILVLNGSYTEIRLIKALKEMGMYVITSGNAPNLEGHKYADEYICHDYSDYVGMLEIAREANIDYVASCANDFGVITAAYIAEKMGLPGHDRFETARLLAEKDRFKEFAQKNELMVIPSSGFAVESEALRYLETVDYPIIVKPTDLTGGKGVSRADNLDEARTAISAAFNRSKAKHIVIEPFIEGSQHSICTFISDCKVVAYTSFDEFGSPCDPYLVGYTSSPASHISDLENVLVNQIEKIADLLSLSDGIFHVQYRMHNDRPLIMEVMRRCLGNHALMVGELQSGYTWEKWQAYVYCGKDYGKVLKASPETEWVGEYYIQADRNGTVKNVHIDPEIGKYIHTSIIQWKPEMVIENYLVEKLGFLFFVFPSCEAQKYYREKFNALIQVEME